MGSAWLEICLLFGGHGKALEIRSEVWSLGPLTAAWKTPGLVPQSGQLCGADGPVWAAHAHSWALGDLIDASRMPWTAVRYGFLGYQWSAWPGYDNLVKEKFLLLLPTAWAELMPGPGLRTGRRELRGLSGLPCFIPQTGGPSAPFLTTVSCEFGKL